MFQSGQQGSVTGKQFGLWQGGQRRMPGGQRPQPGQGAARVVKQGVVEVEDDGEWGRYTLMMPRAVQQRIISSAC